MNRIGRRFFMRAAGAAAALCAGIASGVLGVRAALAAWPQAAFGARDVKGAMGSLYQADAATPSKDVRLLLPEIAENGTQVPVTVATTLPKVESIAIIAEGNPRPLIAVLKPAPSVTGGMTVRVKLAKTQTVTAVVKSDGKLYKASKEINVSVGGCGG